MTAPDSPYGPHAMPIGKGIKTFFAGLAVLGLIAAGAGVASVVNDRSQARSDEIAACRSSFNIELNSAPVANALKVMSKFGYDSPEFRAAADEIDTDTLAALARLSRTDSEEFLRRCRTAEVPPG